MKLLSFVLIVLGVFSALFFFYGDSSEVIYTDKEGLIHGEQGVVTVCSGFPRLKNLYVRADKGSWQQKILQKTCENKVAEIIRNTREKDAEEDGFSAQP